MRWRIIKLMRGVVVGSVGVGAITELALTRDIRILSFSEEELAKSRKIIRHTFKLMFLQFLQQSASLQSASGMERVGC